MLVKLTLHHIYWVSILSTYHSKQLWPAFLYLQFVFVSFWTNEIGREAGHIILVQLTTSLTLAVIFRPELWPFKGLFFDNIFLLQWMKKLGSLGPWAARVEIVQNERNLRTTKAKHFDEVRLTISNHRHHHAKKSFKNQWTNYCKCETGPNRWYANLHEQITTSF